MPPVRFEPTIPAVERPQTYALDRAATGIGILIIYIHIYIFNRLSTRAECLFSTYRNIHLFHMWHFSKHVTLRHYLQTTFIEYLLGTRKIWVHILAVDLLLLVLSVHFFISLIQSLCEKVTTDIAAQYEHWSSYGIVASVKFLHWMKMTCSASCFGRCIP
jgi:hypothetical protein